MRRLRINSAGLAAMLLLVAFSRTLAQQPAPAQSAPAPAPAKDASAPAAAPAAKTTDHGDAKQVPLPRNSDRRRAAKLYLAASKLFVGEQFEEAMRGYQQAAKLDPENVDYPLAASVARSHAVTAQIQAAAKDRMRGDAASARAALAHGLELDPENVEVSKHLNELGDDALLGQSRPLYEQGVKAAGGLVELEPAAGAHSFHLRADQHQIIEQVFKAYGIQVSVDASVPNDQARIDVDDASFEAAARIVKLVTGSFYVPLDAHSALVARDTRENRDSFVREGSETVYLNGFSSTDLIDTNNMAKILFGMPQTVAQPQSGAIVVRGPERTLKAFNTVMSGLVDGRSQVMLEVRLIQIAHTSARNTGVQPPQSFTAFNIYTEEQSILNANQAAVQQIISSGLASANDPLAILGILAASGQVTSSLFTSGFALFGGGLTQSAFSPGGLSANFDLNSSDSRELDEMQLRLGDGEAATIKSGSRYPIQTSSYSALGGSLTVPGLNGAGASNSLSSLLASYGGSVPNIPQIEYQDLGMTLKATPKVMRNNEVALTIDLKIDALAGSSINGNPILNNRAWSGVVTLKQGEAAVVVSQLDKSESRAVSGTPGISEIPGLNDLTGNDNQKNYASLLILFTPHVIRGTQAAGHSRMMPMDPDQPGTGARHR